MDEPAVYEQSPASNLASALAGKRIVVTRAAHQAADLSMLLQARGAEPLPYPCIAIVPPEDTTPLDDALRAATGGGYDWLVLTSGNTVVALSQRLEALDFSLDGLSKLKVAAVGPSTAEAAKTLLGLSIEVLPEAYSGEALVEALHLTAGTRVLLPQSDMARPTVGRQLAASGATVTSVVAYRTLRGEGGVDLPALLAAGQADAITFTSSSTVDHCIFRLQDEGGKLEHLNGVCLACIGPVTAETVLKHGLSVQVMPDEHTLAGLVAGLERYFRG